MKLLNYNDLEMILKKRNQCSICGKEYFWNKKNIKKHIKTKKHQKALNRLLNNQIFKRKRGIK